MRRTRLERLLATVLCVPLAASAASSVPPHRSADEQAMANAIHSVLVHADLTDLHDVSKRLGIHLYRTRFSGDTAADEASRIHATSATVPHFLLANISYEAYSVRQRNFTSVFLRFTARVCPDLRRWARDWGMPYELQFLSDGAGSVDVLKGPGMTPVSLTVNKQGPCDGYLSQLHPNVTSYPPARGEGHDSGSDLVRRIADVVLVGDLRNYRASSRALGVEWVPYGTQREGRLYEGGAILSEPVVGVDASLTRYEVQDSGWQPLPGFTRQARQLAQRSAYLSLSIDTTQLCISADALEHELRGRSPPLETFAAGGQSVLRIDAGGNRIEVSYRTFGRCVETFYLRQVIQRDLGALVGFAPEASLAEGAGSLSPYAADRIEEIIRRLQGVRLQEVDIAECDAPEAVDADKATARHLADLVRSALLAGGIPPERIRLGAAPRLPALSPCSDDGRKDASVSGAASYVTLRALAD